MNAEFSAMADKIGGVNECVQHALTPNHRPTMKGRAAMANQQSTKIGVNPIASVENICEGCGCEFRVPLSHRKQRFHSRRCWRQHADPPIEQRFWNKVATLSDEECWIWQGFLNQSGYGTFRERAKHRSVLAHRFSWELHVGPIGDGLMVCHHCDTPSCVNPSHLFLGTAADNSADMMRKKRWWKGQRPRGSSHVRAKLNEDKVRAIKIFARSGEHSSRDISREFDVPDSTIRHILQGRAWKHVL